MTALLPEVGGEPKDQVVAFQLPAAPFQSSSLIRGRTNGRKPRPCIALVLTAGLAASQFAAHLYVAKGRTSTGLVNIGRVKSLTAPGRGPGWALCASTMGANAATHMANAASDRTKSDLIDMFRTLHWAMGGLDLETARIREPSQPST
jgi:hypothetical protein